MNSYYRIQLHRENIIVGHATWPNDDLRRQGLIGMRLPTPSPRGTLIVIWKAALFLFLMGTLAGCISYGGKYPSETEMPRFPWPPPQPSAFARIPRSLLVKEKSQANLGYVADRLENALNQAGYGEMTWYSVPGGFALASRLEKFNPDGTSMNEPDRWSAQIKAPEIFSLSLKNVLRALFIPKEGHYRVIVFIVTNIPFSAADETVSSKQAMKWVRGGAFNLPDAIRQVDFTPGHYCVALIYEFDQSTRDNPAVFKAPSDLQGETHLRKAKIWSALGG